MKKLMKKAMKGFTLVELIVVIAIIAILSTVGFVSYTGYIRDSRNAVRESSLAEAGSVITQFIATQGRSPKCTVSSPCAFAPTSATLVNGIDTADWAKMNVRSVPADPKKTVGGASIYYVYGTDNVDYEIAATKEEAAGFTAIVKGSKENAGLVTGALGTVVFTSPTLPAGAVAGTDDCTGTSNKAVQGKACVPYLFN